MKYLFLLFLLFFSLNNLVGQNILVEYRQQSLQNYKTTSQTATSSNYGDLTNPSLKRYNADILLGHQSPKFLFSLQFGIYYYQYITFNNWSNLVDFENISTKQTERTYNRFKIGLGIEKKINFDRINLFYGLALPLEIDLKNSNISTFTHFNYGDFNGEKVNYIKHPQYYTTGINLTFRTYFQIIKNFSLGINIINGIYVKIPKSNYFYNETSYDKDRLIFDETQEAKKNSGIAFVKNRDLSFGIQYHFK